MMSKAVIEFINKHQDFIDDEQWEKLLTTAAKDLINIHVKELVNVLHDGIPALDLSDIQWQLLYNHLAERITNLKFIMNDVLMWKLLDDHIFYGLDYTDVKFGLLDDANCAWEEIHLKNNNTYDYKLTKWKGKHV